MTENQANILDMENIPDGTTAQALSDATGLSVETLAAEIKHLETQKLIESVDEQYVIAAHLRQIL